MSTSSTHPHRSEDDAEADGHLQQENRWPRLPSSSHRTAPLGDMICPAYIHMVQHLIEKCLLFGMNRDACVATLEKHASVKPLVATAVWNELEKANPDFFAAYNQRPSSDDDPTSLSRSSGRLNHEDHQEFIKALAEATTRLRQQKLD